MSSSVAFTSGQDERSYIEQAATAAGLDSRAVLAVAAHEGVTLPAEVGDSGTSFGPWQLHAGGALPQSIWDQGAAFANQWANSPAGIDYAIQAIRSAVGGATSGVAQIQAQVTNFERPANPSAEILSSTETYFTGGGPSLSTAAAAGLSTTGTQQTSGTAPNAQGVSAQDVSFGGTLLHPVSSVEHIVIRGLEIVFGIGLVALAVGGIYAALVKGQSKTSVLVQMVPGVGGKSSQPASGRSSEEAATTREAAERRREEAHSARVKLTQARATEVRTRQRHRRAQASASRKSVASAEKTAYNRGAEDVLKEQAARSGARRNRGG